MEKTKQLKEKKILDKIREQISENCNNIYFFKKKLTPILKGMRKDTLIVLEKQFCHHYGSINFENLDIRG